MRKITFKNIVFIIACAIGLNIDTAFSQTWQNHSLVSQYWPNNDVKSYGGKLWVASNDGLFSSSDNGNTWNDLTLGAYSDLVEIQFTNNGNIFVRSTSSVIRSLDGGATWAMDTTGVGTNYGTHVLYYDGASDRVFLGIGFPKYKLYYQSPSDVGWTAVTGVPTGVNNFSPVQMTRKNSKLFIVDIYKRVLESSDNGLTWIQKTGTGLADAQSQVGPSRFLSIGNDLYYGIAGIWKSTNDGDSWTRIDVGFSSADTRCLYYDGANLYASTYSSRKTYKSTDNGITWTDFGGSGSWFFKAMTMHNGSLYGVIHSKDSLYILGSGTSAISENIQNINFQIYPNPTREYVSISNIPDGSTIKVFDITGKTVYQTTAGSENITIHADNFANGLYNVQIEHEGTTGNKKLLINR